MHIPVAQARRGLQRGWRPLGYAKPAAYDSGTTERDHNISRTASVVREWRSDSTAAQQSSRQQGLHIPSPICDQVDGHALPHDAIDEPVGLEKHLPVVLITQAAQFL